MKKNTIKAFTLVEMLIVIVIIGILIASLMPRMQSAQGRARDVARKNDLSQIQTAIITSQSDRGSWPGMGNNHGKKAGESNYSTDDDNSANTGISIDLIGQNLLDAGMTNIPADPNGSNIAHGLGNSRSTNAKQGQYYYLVGKRNGVANAGFALMAKTEVEGGSNWVVCMKDDGTEYTEATISNGTGLGYITSNDDLAKIKLCGSVTQCPSSDTSCKCSASGCTYKKVGELRYLLLY